MSKNSAARRGFTIIELIIVIAILAILIALLLPAIQAARAAARRTQSINNLRNIVLGSMNYEAAMKGYPALFYSADETLNKKLNPAEAADAYPWTVMLLPFIEEAALYTAIDDASEKFKLPSTQVKFGNAANPISPATTQIIFFRAPQLPQVATPGLCNYIALPATRQPLLTNVTADTDGKQAWGKLPPEGILLPTGRRQGIRPRQITDGLSKTVYLSESRELERANWFSPTQVMACGFLPADTQPIDEAKTQYYPYLEGETWHFNKETGNRSALNYGPKIPFPPGFLGVAQEKQLPPALQNSYNPDRKDPLTRDWGPSGGHLGGVTAHAMGDGSVHAFHESLDPEVYFKLLTRAGGEVVSAP
jgi:prepilin-type N-terminal cleavage/methylation domain-containing protein